VNGLVVIVCDYSKVCTDYPEKCGDCANNKVKSYYVPKSK